MVGVQSYGKGIVQVVISLDDDTDGFQMTVAEYFLPSVVTEKIEDGSAEVKVLRSADKWYGVTYKEDKETVVNALQSMKDNGLYPEKLWN